MDFIHRTKRTIAVALALVMMLGLSACGAIDNNKLMDFLLSQSGVTITAGERLIDSAWINSDIEGSIDENTELSLKDDFHTAVNRDWLLETVAEGNESITNFVSTSDAMTANVISILRPGGDYEPDENIMSEEELSHLEELIWNMMELAGDQEARNELGTEPLVPYLEAISSIESLDEMTEYLKNTEGTNFTTERFFGFSVDSPISTRDYYTVHISFPTTVLLPSGSNYRTMAYSDKETLDRELKALKHVLVPMGYSEDEVKALFMDCYDFEVKMIRALSDQEDRQTLSYLESADNIYSLDQLEEMQGNFPLTELLASAGLTESENFILYEPGFLRNMSRLYTEKNLEGMKAYFTVYTVLEALAYLDEECQSLLSDIMDTYYGISAPTPDKEENEPEGEGDNDIIDEEAAQDLSPEQLADLELAQEYVFPNLLEVFQLAYIGRYCSSTMKADITKLLEDVQEYYAELLSTTEWLSPQTREKAIEKVNKIEFNVLYPDELADYSELSFEGYEEGGNLLEAVATINRFQSKPDATRINQPVSRSDWNLNDPTTATVDINAYYMLTSNTIFILAGIISDGFFYSEDAPIEVNYGRLGVVLGHEMSHAFDTSGYQFDSEGLMNYWWTNDDEVAFRQKSDRLANHYSLLSVYPGSTGGYNGELVQSEAIADMGGLKCMLGLAEDIPDFDYELFFKSYAELWRQQTSLAQEMLYGADVHPLNFLRTNVTLQQFDKFYETFDIGPGDGMYLAPEDRIMVW